MPPRLVFTLAALLLAGVAFAGEPAHVDIFTAGKDGYHTYRIPALIATKKGTLLAFCEGRKTGRGDHGDVDLVLKRSRDGGRTWGPGELVYEEGGAAKITIGNPCPVIDEADRTIWLPFTRDNRDVFVTHSRDDGKTWAKPTRVTASVMRPDWLWVATGPGVGIQLRRGEHKGRLVIPCDHKVKKDGKDVSWSHVMFSDDRGKTWQLGGEAGPHSNECQVAELSDGALVLNMRNHWGREAGRTDKSKRRLVARSTDGGRTWSEPTLDDALIEPVCQASLLRVPGEGQRLLFANPAGSKREKLTVRVSDDDGRSWPRARVLHAGPAAYSSLAVLPDGSVGCLYERGTKDAYETIAFARWREE